MSKNKKKNKKYQKYLDKQIKHLEDNMEQAGTEQSKEEKMKEQEKGNQQYSSTQDKKETPAEQFYEGKKEDVEIGPPKDLDLKLQIEKENSIALTRLLRQLQADFDNYRRRNVNIKQEAYEDGINTAIKRMMNCYDAIEGALKSINDEKVQQGLEILKRDFLNAFADFGVTPIEALGKQFDANLHNAISTEDGKGKPSGTVTQEIQKGFSAKDKVLRYSLVIIAK